MNQPLPHSQRLESLDVMRGVALLGIFVMNMAGFSDSFYLPDAQATAAPDESSTADHIAQVLKGWWMEGRFNGLFTLLFGMGLALQLQRLSVDGIPVVLRRMAVLFAFGLLHATLLWNGDVLHIYAVLGLMLLLLNRAPPRLLLCVAIALYGAQVMHGVAMADHWTLAGYRSEQAFLQAQYALDQAVYGEGSWWSGVQLRASELWITYTLPSQLAPVSWFWLALMNTAVWGLWAQRSGWLTPGSAAGQWLGTTAAAWVIAGMVAAASMLWWASWLAMATHKPSEPPTVTAVLGWAANDLSRIVMVLAYGMAILRWCSGTAAHGLRLRLALVGRMPLSQYLLQSLMGTFIFHGWGLGYWGELGAAAQILLAVALFACVQVPLASWWMSRHSMGPLEAVWRRLSYGTR